MKKWWLLPALAVFLAACGNDEEAKPVEDEDIAVEVIEPEEEPEVTEPDETEILTEEAPAEEIPADEPNASYEPSNSNLLGHEEAEVLAEHIPLDELTAQVEADNQGKRIILFENKSGKKVYKSIFIKHDNHLKIIDLNGDKLLFEGKL
ncbi:hypothetical protein [Sporosarcina ureae]|uniref:Lipoprotein n=1 Tax=Sporosarcina ureae TaxID=1571 RepID=A0ABM6JTD6_SPOUR|nr:hypothetical protein [Sporosarcina ureae]ARF13425.1 hypothetical protein SporoS204_04035 [Sporosarcina ureae]